MNDVDGFGSMDLSDYVAVSRETLDRLEHIVDTLGAWRHSINLIGPREYDSVWRRHVLDSLQLADCLTEPGSVIDMGSGGGFPALILAAARDTSDGGVHMVESVGKKCAYLKHVVRSLSLNAQVHHMRIQDFQLAEARYITARAFAALPDLLAHSEPWLASGAIGLFPKGQNWQEELTSAQKYWKFAYEAIPSVSHADGVILKISEVSRVAH